MEGVGLMTKEEERAVRPPNNEDGAVGAHDDDAEPNVAPYNAKEEPEELTNHHYYDKTHQAVEETDDHKTYVHQTETDGHDLAEDLASTWNCSQTSRQRGRGAPQRWLDKQKLWREQRRQQRSHTQ